MARTNAAQELTQSWPWSVLDLLDHPLFVTDEEGVVLQMNGAFVDMFGHQPDAAPLRPPYPWLPPTEGSTSSFMPWKQLAADGLPDDHAHVEEELSVLSRDGTRLWVSWWAIRIACAGSPGALIVHSLRDITKEHAARERRSWATRISAELTVAKDLDTVLAVAENGFAVLFDGGSTVQVSVGGDNPVLLRDGAVSREDELPEVILVGLHGTRNSDALHPRPGILLVPSSSESDCRVWVQFPHPRRIGVDEMIVADLLGQIFALAVDRVVALKVAKHREADLLVALESHRLIGQAVGIIVERHRVSPMAAFERLKKASQNRNIKLRELAVKVVEQGVEPEAL